MWRRAAPVLVAVGVIVLLLSHVLYISHVHAELRREEVRTRAMIARIYTALGDPATSTDAAAGTAALFDLAGQIKAMGVPLIVTDSAGTITDCANVSACAPLDSARALEVVRALDRENPPLAIPQVGELHFGHTPALRWLRVIPTVQGLMLGVFLIAAGLMLRVRARTSRDRIWTGMARESAHQLGTPLSSLSGWLELMESSPSLAESAIRHMRGDLERLERVAHRFERIGREARREPVDIGALADRVSTYFRARVPTLAHSVVLTCEVAAGDRPLVIDGDPVLLEWALESIVKNAIDALAGRGGHVRVEVDPIPEHGGVRLRIADDGPGIPRDLRARIFEPGFSTKASGWGIGLSLARRIVEENHGGRLVLVPSAAGAVFDIILR